MFSILTPTRNALGFIAGCVASVACQAPSHEHLVADGGSTDGTREYLEGLEDVILVSDSDQGMYDGLNRAIHASRGQYISWLNSDEQLQPGALEQVRDTFSESGADLVVGNTLLVTPEGEAVGLRTGDPLRARYIRSHILHAMSAGIFFHRRLAERGALWFDSRLRIAADMDLILRLLAEDVHVEYVDETLAAFAVHPQNLSQTPAADRETEHVRLRHGAPRRVGRLAWRVARQVERELRRKNTPRRIEYVWRSPGTTDPVRREATVPIRRVRST